MTRTNIRKIEDRPTEVVETPYLGSPTNYDEMLKRVNDLRLYQVRGRSYLDTNCMGLDVWYETYLKAGDGKSIFMVAIENPDRRQSLVTATEMGEGRNLVKNVNLVKQLYDNIPGLKSAGFPSYPTEIGPAGVVILNRDGGFEEIMGFSGKNLLNGYSNEEYNNPHGLFQTLYKKYWRLRKNGK